MRLELYNSFVVAAGEVLTSEVGVCPVRGPLTLQRDAHVTDDIAVLVSVVGDVWGIAIYSLSFATAKSILSRMLGYEVSGFDELAQSGIAELGNVITGRATMKLAELGIAAQISVPTLLVGRGSRVSTLDIDRLVVPLETDLGTFVLNLALRESGKASNGGLA